MLPPQRGDQLVDLIRDLLHLALRRRIARPHVQRVHAVAVRARFLERIVELLLADLSRRAFGAIVAARDAKAEAYVEETGSGRRRLGWRRD